LSVISYVWKISLRNEEVKSLYLHLSEFTYPKGHMPFKHPSVANFSAVIAKTVF